MCDLCLDHVYWANLGDGSAGSASIMRVPIEGGSAEELVIDLDQPVDLAADADGVYWVDYATGTVGTLRRS